MHDHRPRSQARCGPALQRNGPSAWRMHATPLAWHGSYYESKATGSFASMEPRACMHGMNVRGRMVAALPSVHVQEYWVEGPAGQWPFAHPGAADGAVKKKDGKTLAVMRTVALSAPHLGRWALGAGEPNIQASNDLVTPHCGQCTAGLWPACRPPPPPRTHSWPHRWYPHKAHACADQIRSPPSRCGVHANATSTGMLAAGAMPAMQARRTGRRCATRCSLQGRWPGCC